MPQGFEFKNEAFGRLRGLGRQGYQFFEVRIEGFYGLTGFWVRFGSLGLRI